MLTTQQRAETVKKFGKNPQDTGSVATQVALLTERIKELSTHFEKNKNDHSGMRGLMRMIGKRRSLLKYLNDKDPAQYQKLISDVGLRK